MLDWIALKHPFFIHVPVAAGLLLPFALLAAQRPGRGIKPWWTACRYLGWTGILGCILAVVSGYFWARQMGMIQPGRYLVQVLPGNELQELMRRHQLFALTALPWGLLTLLSLYRRRQEHQGLGFLPLLLGSLWCASLLGAGYYGGRMTHPPQAMAALADEATKPPPPLDPSMKASSKTAEADPEEDAPLRALDYLSLEPMHADYVKSPQHGGRWIRVWATPSASEAYQEGRPIPAGSYVVMSSLEDRFGRPGTEPGPLYMIEMMGDKKPRLTFYWPRVPEGKRGEAAGQSRAYWRGEDPNLKGCLFCHSNGTEEKEQRSSIVWRPRPVRPAPSEAPAAE